MELSVYFGFRSGWLLAALFFTHATRLSAEQPARAKLADNLFHSVDALWQDYDPRKDPLEARTVREWTREGVRIRYVTFHVSTFKDKPARIAAFFGLPANHDSSKKLPGLLHLHGGGQRAFQHEVIFYARLGYACLSINWGGREMEDAKPGDENTDWGSVDPTQENVPGYMNLQPGGKYLDPFESPRNNNWYLLTLASRRGLTFLEQQPEVDARRLGVYGHSMGGNLTVYVAGTDSRVKVAAPSVGGQGFCTVPWKLLPQQRRRIPNGSMELYRKTLGFQSYAPHVKVPLLWLSATNDFHQIMDDTYRTGDLIPGEVRYSFAPHLNHRFSPDFAVTRQLWLRQHLKTGPAFPKTPASSLTIKTKEGVPRFSVEPDATDRVDSVQILYSIDPDPQARFWRTATATRKGNRWEAALPIMSLDEPLFAFANVHYRLSKPEAVPFANPTNRFALSSQLHTATPDSLKNAAIRPGDRPSEVIDDFSRGWQDWYELNANNPHHWQYWTRKISDAKWRGSKGDRLTLEVTTQKANELVVAVTQNFFRSYRGRSRDYVAVVNLAPGQQTVRLNASDFQSVDNDSPLTSWGQLDLLGLRAFSEARETRKIFGTRQWQGPQPEFSLIRWERTSTKQEADTN